MTDDDMGIKPRRVVEVCFIGMMAWLMNRYTASPQTQPASTETK